MVCVKKLRGGVVGVLDDGTLLVADDETERDLKSRGVKVIRVGKITTS